MHDPLLLLGASVRAAAFSAYRTGRHIVAGDLFVDRDLAELGPAGRCLNYPHDLERIARRAPPGPWMYTGGLENHPELVDRIAARRPLWGNRGDVLRAVRSPQRLADILAADDLPFPEVASQSKNLPRDGSWLLKRTGASGGGHVCRWTDLTAAHKIPTDAYFQRFIAGESRAAVFAAAAGRCRMLGVSRQRLAVARPHEGAFRYAGSMGPLLLAESVRRQFERVGACLAREFGLTGLFGVDIVMTGDQVWVIEVNPRYTASVEVLERALGVQAIDWHAAACERGELPAAIPTGESPVCGKAILYARTNFVVSHAVSDALSDANQGLTWPATADIPPPGAEFQAGQPVVTVFADADDEATTTALLAKRVQHVETILYG